MKSCWKENLAQRRRGPEKGCFTEVTQRTGSSGQTWMREKAAQSRGGSEKSWPREKMSAKTGSADKSCFREDLARRIREETAERRSSSGKKTAQLSPSLSRESCTLVSFLLRIQPFNII